MRSVAHRSSLMASLAMHVALLGWLMLHRPHLPPSAVALEQPVEVLFEAETKPAPENPLPAVMPDLPPEPAVPTPPEPMHAEPTQAPVEQSSSEPSPELIETPASPPPPLAPAPSAVPPSPPARPKPVLARPSHPAAQAAPAPATSAGPATPAAAPPVARPVAAAATTDPGWRAALGNWLAAHKRYPERARQRGDEGTVGIRFTVDAGGRVLDVAVVRSSGSILLDDAARDMLAGQRVPPFPAGMTLAQTTLPVDIRFQLEQ